MDNHPIENLMRSTMENIKDMIDVNTIIGDAVEVKDGSIMIPISKVSFGFVSGGSEFKSKTDTENNSKYPFGGGSGAGVSVKPVAFLVLKNDGVRLLSVDHETSIDRIIDNAPQFIEMLKNMGKGKTSDNNCCEKSTNSMHSNSDGVQDKESNCDDNSCSL
jgi:sporulation protein YtfJ